MPLYFFGGDFLDNVINSMFMFFIFCFAGWIWESSYISVKDKHITNRGFLNGPYIPIYGFGGISIYLVFQQYATTFLSIESIKIYFAGLIFATILEYITSFLMEKIFKARWWDYSNDFMNLNGRICLISSLFWGFLSVLFVQVVNPFFLLKISKLSHDLRLIIVTAISTTMTIDLVVTINSVINLQQKMSAVLRFDERLEALKNKLSDLQETSDEYRKLLSESKEKLYSITNPFTKRLIHAFPNLKFSSTVRQRAFEKVKELRKSLKNR